MSRCSGHFAVIDLADAHDLPPPGIVSGFMATRIIIFATDIKIPSINWSKSRQCPVGYCPLGVANTALAAENMLLEAKGLSGIMFSDDTHHTLSGDSNHDLAQKAGVVKGYTVHCAVIVSYAAAESKFGAIDRSKRGNVNYMTKLKYPQRS